ncbi:nac domain-containing protein 21/22 [Quercus suber]|uniref:Nac domain-containing protein 21/22 n=1 Tax=Quercus suber TaxID=58331 RepID=A0AAW0IJ40_QUESU
MGNCYDDTGSSTLPALMDFYINFDQPKAHADEYEQMPCFSIFNQNQNHNQTSSFFTHMTKMEPNPPTTKINTETTFKGLPNNIGTYLDPFSCDNKELKVVLSQLSNMDSNHEKYSLLI